MSQRTQQEQKRLDPRLLKALGLEHPSAEGLEKVNMTIFGGLSPETQAAIVFLCCVAAYRRHTG